MTNPYRIMCAELIEAVLSDDSHIDCVQIARRARALLAQQPVSPPYKLPEPEGPTDEELLDLADWEVWDHQLLAFARAAIARHGRPTPQPVAVSERLPGPEDCDEQGRCWLWERDCGYTGRKWALVDRAWSLSQSDEDLSVYTHWLPSNALPTPEATND